MQSHFSGSRLPTPVGVVGGARVTQKQSAAAYRACGGANLGEAVASGNGNSFDHIIRAAAQKEGLDENLVKAVIQAESNFNPTAVSPVGAKGLMQLMDSTAKALGVEDPFDPVANVMGGVKFLRSMLDRFQSIPLALAAYNAGPGTVEQYGGVPPYSETRAYIDRVMQLQQANASRGSRSGEERSNGEYLIG
ncbi:MAG: lytic transglycosylase domain-containing protein [Chloroflexota bacterium]|jgi:soluble lytic murein transglycosylase-like protein